jgi:hypothetical protein
MVVEVSDVIKLTAMLVSQQRPVAERCRIIRIEKAKGRSLILSDSPKQWAEKDGNKWM